MKTTKIVSIYLSEEELKEALSLYLYDRGYTTYSDHLDKNEFIFEVTENGFYLGIDGEIEEKTNEQNTLSIKEVFDEEG